MLDVNLVGPWRVTCAALPALRESRGRVVNVASGLAHVTVPFSTAYTLSKRGVVAYSDLLRLEEGDRIDVTTVYPGYIRTAIHKESMAAGVPLEGAVPVEDVRTPPARSSARLSAPPPATSPPPARERSATPSSGSRPGAWSTRSRAARCAASPARATSPTPVWRARSPSASRASVHGMRRALLLAVAAFVLGAAPSEASCLDVLRWQGQIYMRDWDATAPAGARSPLWRRSPGAATPS